MDNVEVQSLPTAPIPPIPYHNNKDSIFTKHICHNPIFTPGIFSGVGM